MAELSKGLPTQIGKYLEYVSQLKFDKTPDYAYCKRLFKDVMQQRGHEQDIYYDWLNKKMHKTINYEDYTDYDVNDPKNSTKKRQSEKKLI